MKFFQSLRGRFLLMVFVLFVFLIGSILIMIEKREVKAIFDEQIKNGLLIARYVKQLNISAFVRGDVKGITKNLESQIDIHVIYIAMFDRNGTHFASTDFIKQHEGDDHKSNLPINITPQSYLAERKMLIDKTTGQELLLLEVEMPIFYENMNNQWGSIEVGISLEESLLEIRETRKRLLAIGLIGLVIGLIGATFLSRRITRPLHKLVDGTIKISKGDFGQLKAIHSYKEIKELSTSFNQMSRNLQESRQRMEAANQKLIQAEKLASIGRMSAGIAHEIRNPLTSIKLNIQKVVGDNKINSIEKSHLEISQEGIKQIEIFITELLHLTRIEELDTDFFQMKVILDESIKMVQDALELKKIKVLKQYENDIPSVKVDGNKMRQVFVNLLNNAYDALEQNGIIEVKLNQEEKGVNVEISDNGCGISENDKDNVFEPYYTTKSSGFGLGLANARKIVELHKGTISVVDKRGEGAKFKVIIPIEEEK